MEFWGVEVKSGSSLSVDPGEDMIVHISLVALGENKSNVTEPVQLYLEKGDTKLVIGTLSHKKFPHLSTEIVLEKHFKLSHSWKNGSVFFTGYRVDASDPKADAVTDAERAVAKSGVKHVNFQVPDEDDDDSDEESEDDSPDDSSEDSGNEEEIKVTADVDNDEDDDDEDDSSDDEEDDSSDEETPKKSEESKKRVAEANTSKNPTSSKKAKFVTPQKTETKKPHVHIATPHPSKGVKSSSGSNGEASKQQKTPKSGGAFECKPCNRTFTSEMGLQSHTKAKHSAAA